MKKFYSAIAAFLFMSIAVNAQTVTLLKDIFTGTDDAFIPMDYHGGCWATYNNTLFFSARDLISNYELWKTDGTPAGTVKVKEINPGSSPAYVNSLTNINGGLVFTAQDAVNGVELWKTDGTETGTVMVKDINPGTVGSIPSNLVNFNGTIYFRANDGVHGVELWKTDGTTQGTTMVKDLNAGSGSSTPQSFTNVNGTLFFLTTTAPNITRLWKTDGTAAGTVLVKDFDPSYYSSISKLTDVNGILYFSAMEYNELWKSDGTAAGTVLVKRLNQTPGSSALINEITNLNGTVFFSAQDAANGRELWKSDGTDAGTALVMDIWSGIGSSSPMGLTVMGAGVVWFSANNGIGKEIWKSDGTAEGTTVISNVSPGSIPTGGNRDGRYFHDVNGVILFVGNDGIHGNEMFKTNGTTEGTIMLQDINNSGNASPYWYGSMNSKVFIAADDGIHGREMWVINLNVSLPLTLSDFKAQLSGNDGLLNWKTSSEQNTSHFEIERSTDGRYFAKAGIVTAAGNTSTEKQYTYSDRNIKGLNVPVVYYRLKMLDIDGKHTYSKIIAININNKEAVIMLYPNPVRENTTLMISVTKKENITYSIIDASGKMVQQKNIVINEGSNTILIETNSLAAGIYTIALNGVNTNRQVRLIKE